MLDSEIKDELDRLKQKLVMLEAKANGQTSRIEDLEDVKEAFSRLIRSITN